MSTLFTHQHPPFTASSPFLARPALLLSPLQPGVLLPPATDVTLIHRGKEPQRHGRRQGEPFLLRRGDTGLLAPQRSRPRPPPAGTIARHLFTCFLTTAFRLKTLSFAAGRGLGCCAGGHGLAATTTPPSCPDLLRRAPSGAAREVAPSVEVALVAFGDDGAFPVLPLEVLSEEHRRGPEPRPQLLRERVGPT